MPTTRFCSVIGVPERTWRRHQARARQARPVKGPWPRPARDKIRDAARRHALAHPAWGHRKVWAMCRHDGLAVSATSVLRLLRRGRPAAGGELPAGTPPARGPAEGGVRGRTDRAESGVAAGLHLQIAALVVVSR